MKALAWLRSLLLRRRLDIEMTEEMKQHIEMQAERNRASGMSAQEAIDLAHRQFGNVARVQEIVRKERGWLWSEQMSQTILSALRSLHLCLGFRDIRYTARSLLHSKAFTLTVLATFALFLGCNVVIFTILHSILFTSLPFENERRLVVPDDSYVKQGLEHVGASIRNYQEWRSAIPAFEETGAYEESRVALGDPGSPEVVNCLNVTPSFFRVLGGKAKIGRLFLDEEGVWGAKNSVVVLSDAFWRRQFAGNAEIIGKTMRIGGFDRYIVGVLPPEFRFLSFDAAVWLPKMWRPSQLADKTRHMMSTNVIARLREGSSLEQAQAQIDALNASLVKDDPEAEQVKAAGFRTTVRGLHAAHVAPVRPALLLLQGGGVLLLIVGVVNVMNLLVVRSSSRANEMSVRLALGASWRNIVVLFLTETALFSAVGAVLALVVAVLTLRLIGRLGLDQLPLGAFVRIDGPVVLYVAASAVVVALILGVPLAVMDLGRGLFLSLGSEQRSVGARRGTHRLRHALIVSQIALAFVLVTGAGLLGLSYKQILSVDPGFRPENLVTAWISLPWSDYKETSKRSEFYGRWLEKLRGLPGVESAGLGFSAPVVGTPGSLAMHVEGFVASEGQPLQPNYYVAVHGDYFKALGIPLLKGRLLNDGDFQRGDNVCLVDSDFVRHVWPRRDPIGLRVSLSSDKIDDNSLRVVGVVGPIKQEGLTDRTARGVLYAPFYSKSPPFGFLTIVRASVAPGILIPELRATLLGIDPLLPLEGADTMQAQIDKSLTLQRGLMIVSVWFAAMALLLAAIGVYGVMSYSVAQRRREIAVRMALGAERSRIVTQFLRLGGSLLLIGLVLGTAASFAVGKVMENLLFEVSPSNLEVYLLTAVGLTMAVLMASAWPTWRATESPICESLHCD